MEQNKKGNENKTRFRSYWKSYYWHKNNVIKINILSDRDPLKICFVSFSLKKKKRQALGKVSFQPMNTGRGTHLPLETNGPDSIFELCGSLHLPHNKPVTFPA